MNDSTQNPTPPPNPSRELRLFVGHLFWPFQLTIRTPVGTAVISHLFPQPTGRNLAVSAWGVVALIALLVMACAVPPSLQEVFVDQKPDAAITVSLICDSGGGSLACSPSALAETLENALPFAGESSVLRLYGLADEIVRTEELARFEVTPPPKPTVRARRAHAQAQREALITQFTDAAAPLFAERSRRASPIAASIALAVLAGNPSGGIHHIILLSDGRDVSRSLGTDLECTAPPDDFAERLAALLPSLAGVYVHFVHARLSPVEGGRCPDPDTRSYQALRDAWIDGLTSNGATVTWSMGPLGGLQ